MGIRFVIEGRLSGANEAQNSSRANRYLGANIKASETKRCAMAAIIGGVPKIKKPIMVHFHWIEPNCRRDLDNIRYGSKYILDGLRMADKLPNDGWAWVRGMSDSFDFDRENPRIEVSINEV